jgi:hypothetical protein
MIALGFLIRTLNEDYDILPLRDDESFSLPFYSVIGDTTYPAVFVYSGSPFSTDREARFFADDVYLFPSSDVTEFQKVAVREFANQQIDEFFSGFARMPNISLPDEYQRALSLLDSVGYQMEMSPQVARDLASAFVNVVPEGLRPFYFSVGFDFFKRVDDLTQVVQ